MENKIKNEDVKFVLKMRKICKRYTGLVPLKKRKR
jgi:hypothetical protein